MAIRNKSPFPYMGSKQRVADDVWRALGNVTRYIEPFFGSGAVLLNRPPDHVYKSEIVNDRDGYVCNFWRAVQADPEGVAAYLDAGPVCELDRWARNECLMRKREEFTASIVADPKWYDCAFAAWWAWGVSVSIGDAWGKQKRSGLAVGPPIAHAKGILHPDRQPASEYLTTLAERLRGVAVMSGDWSRALSNAYSKPWGGATVGVFLDPPYNAKVTAERDHYAASGECVSDAVRAWALEHGAHPQMRIVLCGMGEEHAALEAQGWRVQSWSKKNTFGGMSTSKAERIWYSPHCLGGLHG